MSEGLGCENGGGSDGDTPQEARQNNLDEQNPTNSTENKPRLKDRPSAEEIAASQLKFFLAFELTIIDIINYINSQIVQSQGIFIVEKENSLTQACLMFLSNHIINAESQNFDTTDARYKTLISRNFNFRSRPKLMLDSLELSNNKLVEASHKNKYLISRVLRFIANSTSFPDIFLVPYGDKLIPLFQKILPTYRAKPMNRTAMKALKNYRYGQMKKNLEYNIRLLKNFFYIA